MRYVLTGCAGFIGSHLAEALLARGDEIIGVDCFNDNYGRKQKLRNLESMTAHPAAEFVPIDIASGDLEDIIEGCQAVIHLAAEPGVRTSWGQRYDRYLRNNVLATQRLLEALRNCSGTRLIYASSSSVYGDAASHPTPEGARLRPRSPYGQTKVATEHICDLYHLNFGVVAIGLRFFTVYGPRQRPDMAFHRFCRAALLDDGVTVFGDGMQSRDFTYVDDIVEGTLAAVDFVHDGHRVYNLGGGSPATLRSAISLIEEVSGNRIRVTYADSERGDVRDTAADTTNARNELGFAPQRTLRDGLAAELAWMQDLLTRDRA